MTGPTPVTLIANPPRLADVDTSQRIKKADYEAELSDLQLRLMRVQQAYYREGHRAVVVFEGWDAAGKGGTIRRMAWVLDPRQLKVWPIGAPRGREREIHYLQRFWERLPERGSIAVFDRSWYGRVLVERIEGFATEDEWSRAYDEINRFEAMLHADGYRIVKLFMHISHDAQAKRFRKRLQEPHKRWKLTEEDFRNRDKRPDYERAIDDMLVKTSTTIAPWHVIPSDSKHFGRIAALRAITDVLCAGIDSSPPPIQPGVLELAKSELDYSPPTD